MKSNDHDVVQGEEEKKKNRGKRFYSFTVHLGYILPSYKNSLQSFSRLHWFAFKVFFFFSFYCKESDNSNCISDCLNNLHILTTSVSSYYSILCTFLTIFFKEKFEVYKKRK